MSKNEEPDDLELYWLVFVLLRISPSYELARKAAKGLLTREEKDRLPRDFRRVTETYKLVGDVQRVRFRMWWAARGLRLFGSPGDAPSVQLLGLAHASEEPDVPGIHEALKEYTSTQRAKDGNPAVAFVAIPLGTPPRVVKSSLLAMIDYYADEAAKPVFEFIRKPNVDALRGGVNLLLTRAANPHMEYWRVRLIAEPHRVTAKLNPDADRRTSGGVVEKDARRNLAQATYRDLKKWQRVVENAARGRFLTDEEVEEVEFDYAAIGPWLLATNAWEQRSKRSESV
jgi:hypothetical protein